MIYMASVGVHTICATLAKFSFGVSDSFQVKCIRWEQMGPPNRDQRGLLQILWDTKTTELPTSILKSPENMQRRCCQGKGAGCTSAFQELPKIKINCF